MKKKHRWAAIMPIICLLLAGQAWAGPMEDYIDGRNALAKHMPEESIRLVTKAIDSGGLKAVDMAQAYSVRGQAYRDIGDLDQALSDFGLAIRNNSELAEAWGFQAFVRIRKNQPDQAIADFNRALSLNPKEADYFFGRGNAWFDKKKYDRAIADFDQAVALNPNFGRAFYNRAIAYLNQKDYGKALADAKRAVATDPGNQSYQNLVNEVDAEVQRLK